MKFVSIRLVQSLAALALLRLVVQAAPPEARDDARSRYLPFDMPPYSALVRSPKKVFAHWHVFPISWDNLEPERDFYNTKLNVVESSFEQKSRQRPLPRPVRSEPDWRVLDMMEEIRRAQAIGCDGFWMNHFGVKNVNLENMLEAAKRVNSEFRILLAQDVAGFRPDPRTGKKPARDPVAYYSGLYSSYGKNAFAYRVNGKLAIAGFGSMWVSPAQWSAIFANLKTGGIDTVFFPNFMAWKTHYQQYAGISAGFGDWGTRMVGVPSHFADAPGIAHKLGKLWVMPIGPQEQRVKSGWYQEAKGSELLRDSWMTAIQNDSDWVQLVTWNDYGEGTEISPSTGTQYAYYDLCAYYITWFKTEAAPKIVRDVLYYFHRTQFVQQPTMAGKRMDCKGGKQVDLIELLAFLKAPGTLQIEIGGKVFAQTGEAGLNSFQVPLAHGTPVFKLMRANKEVVSVASAFPILDRPLKVTDAAYKGGCSSRAPVAMTQNYLRFHDQEAARH